MTARYSVPSVEAILEDSEDESNEELRGNDEDYANEDAHRQPRPGHEPNMNPTKTNATAGKERDKDRERSRRSHKSAAGGRHLSKSKSKNTHAKRGHESRESAEVQRPRHRRTLSNRSMTSSSSDEDEPVQDHRAILAATRARLTSPSMISSHTALTTTTNKSSSSSGSNSTVTQASMTRARVVKQPETEEDEPPTSPAVPDPPNVFAFLQKDDEDEESDEHGSEIEVGEEDERESTEKDEHAKADLPPSQHESSYVPSSIPQHLLTEHPSSSSSTSSSFQGDDDSSSPIADNDTDRSTSPEHSVLGHDSEHEHETTTPTDNASVKLASQMAAAHQRQNLYDQMQSYGNPNMQRGNANLPHNPPTTLSPRYPYQASQRPLPRAEKLPLTGYELLAIRLASRKTDSDSGTTIKPMYRKFEALNHRLLLHLQDELSELEDQLHRLDRADTQSRRTEQDIVPASRRAAAQAGGELQWHKTDVLGRIGYKLGQYNQALSSFNTTQSLNAPNPDDVLSYREYLHSEHPIAEPETHFLDPDHADDLVSMCSSIPPYNTPPPSFLSSSYPSESSTPSRQPTHTPVPLDTQPVSLSGLATAVAVSILVPILTFSVIPNFLGRMTVTTLVAFGVILALMQSGTLHRGFLLGSEGLTCAGIYGGVMVVLAGIMA